MKRGISPLIAVVLLVGFSVSLAIILLNFFDVFSDDRIEEIDEDALKRDLCTDKTRLSVDGYCVIVGPTKTDLHVNFENNGMYPIEEIFFKIIRLDDPTIVKVHTYNTQIPGYGIGTFNIQEANVEAGDYNVIIEKKLDSNGTVVYCDPIEKEMELLTCRFA
jgi:hypothetical protein